MEDRLLFCSVWKFCILYLIQIRFSQYLLQLSLTDKNCFAKKITGNKKYLPQGSFTLLSNSLKSNFEIVFPWLAPSALTQKSFSCHILFLLIWRKVDTGLEKQIFKSEKSPFNNTLKSYWVEWLFDNWILSKWYDTLYYEY